MAVFEVEDDQGNIFEIEGPADATDQELQEALGQTSSENSGQETVPESGKTGFQRAMDIARTPERLSREGLGQIASAVPEGTETGNVALDVATGTPRVLAETAAEFIPSLISPEAVVGGVAGRVIGGAASLAKPVISKGGELLAKGVQKLTGVKAENIVSIFKKPISLLTAPTKRGVSKAFSKTELAKAENTVEEIVANANATTRARIKVASKEIFKQGKQASPDKIVRGRKALDVEIAKIQEKMQRAPSGKGALNDELQAKFALREQFNLALDKVAPKLRAADKLASEQFKVDPFRDIALPGNINFFTPKGLARAIPGLPTALGTTVAGFGAAAQQVGNLVNRLGTIGFTGGTAADMLLDELESRRQ